MNSSAATVKSQATAEGPTRKVLLRAAARLFARDGMAASTRAILREANQSNESALQYHFGGRQGLIEELYAEQGALIGEERERMLQELDARDGVDIRDLCEVALMPAVSLARREPEFLLTLKVAGQLAFLPSGKLQERVKHYEGDSVNRLARRMERLVEVPLEVLAYRSTLIHRMAAMSLSQRALAEQSFDGAEADFFFATLLDAMSAVLSGAVSSETEECFNECRAASEVAS